MKKQSGYSLIELLVVVPIIVIASFIAFTVIFRGWQAYQYSLAQADATFVLTNSLDRMSRVIRSTNSIVSASSNELVVETYFSPRDNVPDRARYYISNQKLMVDVTPASGAAPNYTYNSNDTRAITIANITNSTQQPLFKYLDQNGIIQTAPDIASITEVEITLSVNPRPAILKTDQSSTTRVQLRNRKTNL